MTGLLDTTNAPRSVQRKSLPTCTLSLASVSAHRHHQPAVDLPLQSSVVPFPSAGVGVGGAHALLRSSPPPTRVRISTSVTSPSPPSIRRKRSASRLTSPRHSPPATPASPPRKRARTSASKPVLKSATTPTQAPRRAPSADIKLNACVYRTIFTLGWARHGTAANTTAQRRSPRCTSSTPGASQPNRFDDSDDSDLDSEIEEELELAVHHAILEEQDIMLSMRLRCYLLRNGIDPRSVFFETESEDESEEKSVPDPFLKDPGPQPDSDLDRMDVEVEASTPSVPSSSTPISVPLLSRNAPPPPANSRARSASPPRPGLPHSPEARVHFPCGLPITTSSPPPSPPTSPRPKPTLKPAPPPPPPSHLTGLLILRRASRERARYRSIRARDSALEPEVGNLLGKAKANGLAMGRRSPLRNVFSEGDVLTSLSEELQGSVLEDVLMAMMVEEPEGAHVVGGAQTVENAPMDVDA